jgi:hypothetical protein
MSALSFVTPVQALQPVLDTWAMTLNLSERLLPPYLPFFVRRRSLPACKLPCLSH